MIEHRIGTSRRSGALRRLSRAGFRPMLRHYPLRGPAARLMPLVERSAAVMPRSAQVRHTEISTRHWRGELVTPMDGVSGAGAILYLHGGAFLMCGLATHRRIVERLAVRTGLPVLSVGYRQLPRGRLDDSVADGEAAFHWLVRNGHPASRIVLAGDSAGGHLAFAVALRLRDAGVGGPAGLVGLSPWLDFDHLVKLRHHNARRDDYIPTRRLRRVGRMVVGAHPELHHSPVNAELRGLPPTLLICAESEVLRVDAELMADRLADAGVPCTVQVWEGQIHAFPVLTTWTPESRAAVEEVVSFVRTAVAAPGRPGRLDAVGSSDVA